MLQVVYQETDSEAEVEIVDAAAAGESSDGEDDYTTDEGEDEDELSGDDVGEGDSSSGDEGGGVDDMDEDADLDDD